MDYNYRRQALAINQKTISRYSIWLALVLLFCVASGNVSVPQWPDVLSHYSEIFARFLRGTLTPSVFASAPKQFESNGRTEQVRWDNYSLTLLGQRIFLQ